MGIMQALRIYYPPYGTCYAYYIVTNDYIATLGSILDAQLS